MNIITDYVGRVNADGDERMSSYEEKAEVSERMSSYEMVNVSGLTVADVLL